MRPFVRAIAGFAAVWVIDGAAGQELLESIGPRVVSGTPPNVTVAVSHTGNFAQGQVGAQYSLIVYNIGGTPTVGTVTLVDALPAGLTATGLSGPGWSCVLAMLTCTRSDALGSGLPYPITLTVNVASNAPASVVNRATVSGGGDTDASNNTISDPTVITGLLPALAIVKTHGGSFAQGQANATYTIAVSNVGPGPASGTVTAIDTLPAGLTATAMSGTGWSCTLATLTCARADALAAGAGYPVIVLTVDVAANAPTFVVNVASVSGGGDATPINGTSNDSTSIAGALAQFPIPTLGEFATLLLAAMLATAGAATLRRRRW